MPIRTHAEQEEIVPVDRLVKARGQLGKPRIVIGGGLAGRQLALDAENIPRRDRDRVEQRLARHEIIALLILRRHAPLIAEGNLHTLPGEIARGCGPFPVNRRRRPPAGERDAKNPTLRDGLPRGVKDEPRGVGGEGGGMEDGGCHG